MDHVLSFDWGIRLIHQLQGLSPDLDAPFKILSLLGNEGFYLFLLPLIYWCVDRRTGARLAVLFLASAYLNSAAKTLADQPRPFQYDPSVRALVSAGGGGLPSGHTQNSVVVWGFLAMQWKRPLGWVPAVFLMLTIPLSRLYLGVHFPVDLLGGYLLGGAILWAFTRLEPTFGSLLSKKGLEAQLAAALLFPAAMILSALHGDHSTISAGSALMGASVGLVLERKWIGFEATGSWRKRLLRLIIGLAGSLAIWGGLKWAFSSLEPELLYRFVRYCLLGLWASFGSLWIFLRLGLFEPLHPNKRKNDSAKHGAIPPKAS